MSVEDTRERVLREASELFATKGYVATTTREIAAAVGVRQPSLFHHFENKAAIMNELLRHSLSPPVAVAVTLAKAEGSAAERLYAYLRFDVQHVFRSPYNLAGLDSDEVLGHESFAHWRAMQEVLRDARRQMILEAIQAGEFAEIDVAVAHDAITGLILGMIRGSACERRSERADLLAGQAADLALRALLSDPDELDRVRSGLTSLPIIR
jgi:AcrR family transcriptional regulator